MKDCDNTFSLCKGFGEFIYSSLFTECVMFFIYEDHIRFSQFYWWKYLQNLNSPQTSIQVVWGMMYVYFVSPWEWPWCQRVFQRKMLNITRVPCVLSHAFRNESRDWRIKDASCSVFPSLRSVMSRSFPGWDKV